MMEERITSRKNPLLQQIRKLLTSRKARQEAGLFVADGTKLLEEKFVDGSGEFSVSEPVLWNAEKPYLYTLRFERDGEVIERKVGMRSIAISDKCELLINGQSVKLHGVNHHDTHKYNGWCQTYDELRLDLEKMKELNINCVRTSHYPPIPYFVDLCGNVNAFE